MVKLKKSINNQAAPVTGYDAMLSVVVDLLEQARRTSVRAVNTIMTVTYWEVGRRIVEYEQGGVARAEYGAALITRVSLDLTARFGRGFSKRNVEQMRLFYLTWPIAQMTSAQLVENTSVKCSTASSKSFPLPWSQYVRLMSVKTPEARSFYETESLRGGWTGPQLDRQISTLFYERTALSRNKAAMLKKGQKPLPEDAVSPEEEIKDPLVLEFLGLKE
jgi:hypothetical protein